jgi:hypothetical protein
MRQLYSSAASVGDADNKSMVMPATNNAAKIEILIFFRIRLILSPGASIPDLGFTEKQRRLTVYLVDDLWYQMSIYGPLTVAS